MSNSNARGLLQSLVLHFVLGVVICSCFFNPALAAPPNELVSQMLRDGFDRSKANLLYGQWGNAKKIMVDLATSGDPAKIDLAHKIVDYRFGAWEQSWTNTVDDLVKEGLSRPIEGMGPTGGWKAPLAYKQSDPVRFIIDGANADIDATFFGRNPNVTEEFVERAAIKWAARTTGTSVTLPDGSPDYGKINQILKASEVTPFPRHPDGALSASFKRKFPEIVHESYPGAYGQRSLEVEYLNTPKGKADIVRYDKYGNLVKKGGQVQLVRNQRAESLIEDLTNARYTRLDRMHRLAADYNHKYLGNLGHGAKRDAETTAKMLQRMIEGDSRLSGYRSASHPLYDKAKAVKQALREGDDDLVRKALGGQSLDDFMQQAQGEMRRIHFQNQGRLTEMMDDSIGAASATRMNTAIRALRLLGYGVSITDAVLSARTGEEVKEGGKALASAVAADLAGSAVGSAIGGAAGFASGVGTAIVVGWVVNGTFEWTEEGIDNMLGGYKVDAAMKDIFLNPDTVDRFLALEPDEIRRIIEQEWDVQYQWGGAFLGKGGDPEEQLKRKKEIFQKAMEMQSLLNKHKLRSQVVAEIVADELRKLVARYEKGEITAQELAQAREKFSNNDQGLWAAIFGTELEALIQQRLETDYARYAWVFEQLDVEPEMPGLWDALFGDAEERKAARTRADENYALLLGDKASLLDSLAYIDRLMQLIKEAFASGGDITDLYRELKEELDVARGSLLLLQGLAETVLEDLNASYGKGEDLTVFHQRRSAIAALLAELNQAISNGQIQFAQLQSELDRLKRAAAADAVAGLQGELSELEKVCQQVPLERQRMKTSLAEARRIARLLSNTFPGNVVESVESNALAACSTAEQVQATAVQAAETSMGAAQAAVSHYNGALQVLNSCADSDAIAAADRLLGEARRLAREAAQAYTRTLEGADILEQIAAGAGEAKILLESASTNIQQAWIYWKRYELHMENAQTSRNRVPRLIGSCRQNRGILLQKLDGLVQQYPWLAIEASTAALRGRIDSMASVAADDDSRGYDSGAMKGDVSDRIKSVEDEIGQLRARLDACQEVEYPSLAILQSGEALLGLENITQWLTTVAERKKLCLSKLKKKTQVAGGKCEGENWHPGCDPNVTGLGGAVLGSAVPGILLDPAGQAGERFWTRPGGPTGEGEEGDDSGGQSTGAGPISPSYTKRDKAETPAGEGEPPGIGGEDSGAGEVVPDSFADGLREPTFPPRTPVPAVPKVQEKPVAEDPCKRLGPDCYTRPDGKGCHCPGAEEPGSGGEGTQQAQPVEKAEKYGVYLLFDSKSAIWVGPESGLKGQASGTITYGGTCLDKTKCPIVYTKRKGPFDTQEQANDAYCQDVERGPWTSLGVRRVKMTWGEYPYVASKVPSCR